MGAIRCPECRKFARLEPGDVQVDGIDVDADGVISGVVRILGICADCGEELAEGMADFDGQIDDDLVEEHTGEGHELLAEDEDAKSEVRGSGRNTEYGAIVTYAIRCKCQGKNAEPLERADIACDGLRPSDLDTL